MFAPLPLATALAVFLPSATPLPVWMSGALLLAANVYMVERRRERGGDGKLHPARPVQLSSFLESMPEAVLIFDLKGKIVDLNHAAERLAVLPRERLKGMTGAEFLRRLAAQEGDGKPLKASGMAVTRALRGEVVRDARRIFHQSGDGAKVEALVSASPMHDSSGKIIGVLQIIRDITQLTELQQRVAVTERHHAVGQMAAGIAHDFSNVLTTVLQAAAMLETQSQKPAQEWKPYLEIIRKAVRRGNDIISGLREYLRHESAQTSAVDVCRVLEEALELTRPMWQPARDLKVVRHLQAVELVTANAGGLLRVFTNLIINALEAMPKGGTLTVRTEQRNGRVIASVTDTGPGIAREHQKKIFYPYFTTKPAGTGLGLSGAQRILNALGGNISFTTRDGKGTQFVVELPRSEPSQKRDAA